MRKVWDHKKYQQALCKGSQASWPLSANCNNSWTLSLFTVLTCQLVSYKHFVNTRSIVTSLNLLLYEVHRPWRQWFLTWCRIVTTDAHWFHGTSAMGAHVCEYFRIFPARWLLCNWSPEVVIANNWASTFLSIIFPAFSQSIPLHALVAIYQIRGKTSPRFFLLLG